MFDKIVGQDRAINLLKNAIISGRIAQGYIFYGIEGVGKLTTALTFAKIINCKRISPLIPSDEVRQAEEIEIRPCNSCSSCNKIDNFIHPDVKFYFSIPNFDLDEYGYVKLKAIHEKDPEKNADWVSYQNYIKSKINTPWKDHIFDKTTAIRIEQIRGLQKDILLSKYEGEKKVYIIEGFDSLTAQASNAFLKTLEEPPADTHFILIVNNIEKLLPTILSRCVKIKFHNISTNIIENYLSNVLQAESLKARLFSRLANGSLKNAINLYYDENLKIMDITIEFLNIVLASDDIAYLNWIEINFLKEKKNTEIFNSFIQYLCLWVKDLQVYNLLASGEPQGKLIGDSLVFINQIELMEKYILKNRYFSELVSNLLLELDEYVIKSTGNVNQKLILSQVYHSFLRIFTDDK
ncbi:MAG: hypothetical protein FWG98_12020 [Candidatus Cloacimonetes bacterium]|nr:hypothetical protein [Candidatus Cloacimonadota bacterium]